MAMHDHPLTSDEGIPSELVRYLGFKISKDLRLRERKNNFESVPKKNKTILNP